MKRTFCLLACLVLAQLAGCQDDLESISQITKLRVMAIQAEPPEIAPGQGTTLRMLWADPQGAGRPVSFLWLACRPAPSGGPGAASPEGCEPLAMPRVATADEGGDTYALPGTPPDLLDDLPPDEQDLWAPVYALICAGGTLTGLEALATQDADATFDLEALCQGGDAVLATKSIVFSRRAHPNHNPELAAVTVDDGPLAPLGEAPTHLACAVEDGCRTDYRFSADLTAASFETYETTEFGEPVTRDESTYVSWFITAGRLGPDRSGSAEPPGPYETTWFPPREGGPATLWAVAHDLRGGVSWQAFALEVDLVP